MFKTGLVAFTILAVCFGQQTQGQGSGSDKQVRLEDIERDTLTSAQQRQQQTSPQQAQQTSQHQHQHQHQHQQQQAQQYGLSQQQLAAYQQQLLLQQLQQQYFAPQTLTYPGYNAVPLMIIPGNHLGVGSPALPLQAYFLPPESLLYQQQLHAASQNPGVTPQANNLFQVTAQRLQQAPRYQQVGTNQVFRLPQQAQPAVHNFIYASSPQALQQQQAIQSAPLQQPYNAYNAIYQQRQQKNLYSSGIKSTPAPPSLLKSSSQSIPFQYSQALQNGDQSSSYINYKSF